MKDPILRKAGIHMELNLIMPMGGGGTRFEIAGYEMPKPLIEIYGKPFFYWATQSIIKFMPVKSLTFVVLKEHAENYRIDQKIAEFYPEANIVTIPEVLPGAVLTCLKGLAKLQEKGPILFNDCDHLFICKAFYDFCAKETQESIDGGLLTFPASDDRYSYVEFDSDGGIVRTVEKEVVSNAAICGAYYFRDKELFEYAAEEYLQRNDYAEYFISGVYNVLCRHNAKIQAFPVDRHISFGTPEEYAMAQNDGSYRLLE